MKAMSVTVSTAERLVRTNSRVTVPPGATGSSVNSLVSCSRVEVTVSTSAAGGTTTEPPWLADKELVELM